MFLCFGSVDGKIKWEMVVREEIGLYGRGWCLVLMVVGAMGGKFGVDGK